MNGDRLRVFDGRATEPLTPSTLNEMLDQFGLRRVDHDRYGATQVSDHAYAHAAAELFRQIQEGIDRLERWQR